MPSNCFEGKNEFIDCLVEFPTRNRTAELDRSLRSYVENARAHEREIQFSVSDQSDEAQSKDANLSVLERIGKDFAVSVSYGNYEEKRAFAKELAAISGVSRDILDFALFNPMQIPCAVGANRNALLLQAVGELTVQVDDDTLCRLAPSPSLRQGITVSSKRIQRSSGSLIRQLPMLAMVNLRVWISLPYTNNCSESQLEIAFKTTSMRATLPAWT